MFECVDVRKQLLVPMIEMPKEKLSEMEIDVGIKIQVRSVMAVSYQM